jgi:hypothetical protein
MSYQKVCTLKSIKRQQIRLSIVSALIVGLALVLSSLTANADASGSMQEVSTTRGVNVNGGKPSNEQPSASINTTRSNIKRPSKINENESPRPQNR